jgi:predicted RNA-binding protein Jag
MYDARNERHEFVGENTEAAVQKAVAFFGVGVEDLVIGEFPKGEVYGLGGRSVIVASLRGRKVVAAGRSEGRGARREEGGRGERRGRGGERRTASDDLGGRGSSQMEQKTDGPEEPSVGTVEGEIGEIGRFVLGVLERLGLGPFEISESAEGNLLVFQVKGPAIRRLASGDGRAADALQLLANQAAKRSDGDAARVVIDVE